MDPPACLTVGRIQARSIFSSLDRLTNVRRFCPNTLNLDSSVQSTCLHCSAAQSACARAHCNLFRRFPRRSNGFRTATRPCKFASCRRRFTVLTETVSARPRLKSLAISGAVSLLFRLLISFSRWSSAFVVIRGRPLRARSAKSPVVWYRVMVSCTVLLATFTLLQICRTEYPSRCRVIIADRFAVPIGFPRGIFNTLILLITIIPL